MTAMRGYRGPRLAAEGLIAIVAAIFVLFAVGEIASGDVSGVQHIPEAVLLVALMVVAWRYPRGAGLALMGIGLVILVFMLMRITSGAAELTAESVAAWSIGGILLFGFPFAAGWLLLRSSR